RKLQAEQRRSSGPAEVAGVQTCRSKNSNPAQRPKQAEQATGGQQSKNRPNSGNAGARHSQWTGSRPRANDGKPSCTKCGMTHAFKACPAFGQICHKCKKRNHFAVCCKTTSVHEIQEDEEDNVFYIGLMTVNQVNKDK